MIIVLGLVVLVVAAVVALAGIFGNTGAAHELSNPFTVFGHHMTGSTGTLFLYGIVVGAVAMLGLAILLTGVRRASRRNADARHGLRESRREREAVAKSRDDLVEQRDTARAEAASAGRDRDGVAGERDTLTRQRDDLAEQRDSLTRQRDDLMNGHGGAHEQTAGTRVAPMRQDPEAQDEAGPRGYEEPDRQPQPRIDPAGDDRDR
ncbi:hypothetical protein AB0K43_11125 [Kitasatospora sp. NPDC049258]|uniref:hypothetical protein n=1 Tax=Kitasatospora sp. NPDC049258 TaxID=3155394 RepID=UPI00342C3AD0